MKLMLNDQARREILLSLIAVAVITAVTVLVIRTEDNYLRQEITNLRCEQMWMAAVISVQNDNMRDTFRHITHGKLPSQVASSVACQDYFEEKTE